MKKLLLLLVLPFFGFSQGSEDFTNSNATATWADNNFIGNNGLTCTYVHSRNEDVYPINGKGLILRRGTDSYLEITIPTGVGTFSFDYRKAYVSTSARQLEVIVNGVQVALSPVFGTLSGEETTVYNLSSTINNGGPVTIRIKPTGITGTSRETTIDNISWTLPPCTNTFSSISPVACDSYVSPSGNYTWTSTNTYYDTIPNAASCDSVITVNLTVNSSDVINTSATICTGETYIFGTQTLTDLDAGLHTEVYTNTNMCDSTVNLTLIVNDRTYSTIDVTECDSYISPSGSYSWTASNTYLDTIPNAMMCDSVITINLTINSSETVNASASICTGETYIFGTQTLTDLDAGLHTEVFTNANMCDSTVNLTLTVNSVTYSSITVTECDSYTSPSGNYTWTTSNTYNDTIQNAASCDSVITIDLTIIPITYSSIAVTACDSYTPLSGNNSWTTTGTYYDTIPNAMMCDSVITVNLTINPIPTVTLSAFSDVCINYSAFSLSGGLPAGGTYSGTGVTGGTFAPSVAGNGTHTITYSYTDGNNCFNFVSETVTVNSCAGVNENNSIGLVIYPNPSEGILNVKFDGKSATMTIVDLAGKTIVSKEIYSSESINVSSLQSGTYLVNVTLEGATYTERVIVK